MDFHREFTNFVTSSMKKGERYGIHFEIKLHLFYYIIYVYIDLLIRGKIDLFFYQRYNVMHIG